VTEYIVLKIAKQFNKD